MTAAFPQPAEATTAVVLGAGLPGLAVATELSRRGVHAILVEGPGPSTPESRPGAAVDPAALSERTELMRLLRAYAASHALDIRRGGPGPVVSLPGLPGHSGPGTAGGPRWAVPTEQGVVVADHVVLTGWGGSQLRRMLRELGVAAGENIGAALKATGLYVVGMADLLVPTTREIVRQAKAVTDAIVLLGEPATNPA